MKAVVGTEYGPPDRLEVQDVDMPVIGESELLLRVHAASLNSLDWRLAIGRPYVMRPTIGWRRPKRSIRGVDVAGVVESVAADVTRFKPGDEVFGLGSGSFAEYVSADESELAIKPEGLSFEMAAAMPVAGCTALQALQKHGDLQSGQSVLVNGAAGGVGTSAVQIAKALGGRVAGVCSGGNVDLVRSLGADEVIDYERDDFSRFGVRYDLVVDAVGNRSLRDLRRVTTERGSLIMIGGGGGNLIGPLGQMAAAAALNPFIRQKIGMFVAKVNPESLGALADLHAAGKLAPAISRTVSLGEAPEAISRMSTGHTRGKTVIVVNSQ
jgi:NADPH:quinone reductase-like Zn-dependent oxidoreductase